jgi:hypothetical protein
MAKALDVSGVSLRRGASAAISPVGRGLGGKTNFPAVGLFLASYLACTPAYSQQGVVRSQSHAVSGALEQQMRERRPPATEEQPVPPDRGNVEGQEAPRGAPAGAR